MVGLPRYLAENRARLTHVQDALIQVSLYHAVKLGTPGDIKARLDAGDDVNEKDHNGNTALHVAAFHRSVDIAEILINAGADINALNYNEKTPLHIAQEQLQRSQKLQTGVVNRLLLYVAEPLPIERQKAMVNYLVFCKWHKDNVIKQADEPELITRRKCAL